MGFARVIVEGVDWEFAGTFEDEFLGTENELTATRQGTIYADPKAAVKRVTITDIMAPPDQFEEIADFFESCGTRRFVVTLVLGEDCDDDGTNGRYIYYRCILDGRPSIDRIAKKMSNFAFGYEGREYKTN